MIEWHLETLAIKDLKPHPKNPRQINKQQLQHLSDLMDKFGLIDRPIVNTDMMIIGGHQRIKILKKKKVKSVECWLPNSQLSEEDIDHLCIGLNLNQGSFCFDTLGNLWEPLDLLKWGFTEDQLMGTIKELEENSGEESKKKSKMKTCPSCGHEF